MRRPCASPSTAILRAQEPPDPLPRQADHAVAPSAVSATISGERVARDGERELEVQRQVVRHGTGLDPRGVWELLELALR